MKWFIDFETQSECDLAEGTDKYAKHPSTDITTMAFGRSESDIQIWYPGKPRDSVHELLEGVRAGEDVWAHNATFEWYIWNFVCVPKYNFPPLKLSQIYCTMSMANAMGLPGSLDHAASAAGLNVEKDKNGYRIMMMLCKPNREGRLLKRADAPDKFQALDDYCIQDVKIEMALSKRLAPLLPYERKIWLLDQKINYRGVGVDIKSAQILDKFVDEEQARLLERFTEITKGFVPTPKSHAKFKTWLSRNGLEMESIAKDKVAEVLKEDAELDDLSDLKLSPAVKEAILIRKESAKSSNAKIKMMLKTEVGGRVRNMVEYYGAKQTGRWAGRKLQLHNFPRPKLKIDDINDVFNRIEKRGEKSKYEIEMLHGAITNVTSDCLRSLLIPHPGKKFIVADWSNIEGRGLAWLAGEEWKIKAFQDFDKGIGSDIYKLTYSKSFHKDVHKVNDDDRQIGKTLELACGYQGAVGAFHTMAKTLGVKVSDERAKELVEAWRGAHPRTKAYWYKLEEAAIEAILHPKTSVKCGKVTYKMNGSFLCCRLPSGRVMYYPYPTYEKVEAPWGGEKLSITFKYQDPEKKIWIKTPTYGGSLAENITQGLCRDILAEGLMRVEEAGYSVVVHVHDEIVTEVDKDFGSVRELERLMSMQPAWADGLPLAAKGYEGLRYRKG